jgi:uncharacterized protein (TIGR02271 family)
MNKSNKKVQLTEFEEKLQESRLKAEQTDLNTGSKEDEFQLNREERVIPVIEEQVQVNKKVVESGKVRISKNVHEDEVLINVPIVHEEVDVQRIPINQYVDQAPPAVRYEGDKTIVTVLREELVLVKRIKVVEELHIINRKIEEHSTQPINLRREEINIERVQNDDPDSRQL